MESRTKPSRREASVPEETVAKERIIVACIEHDPEKWAPVFRSDHAPTKRATSLAATRANVITASRDLMAGIRLMADARYDVLGIGNAIFDVLVRTDEKFLA